MPFFAYKITTTNSEADGQIEAENEVEARQVLTKQYVPEEHNLIDEEGEPIEHKLVNIELTPVT